MKLFNRKQTEPESLRYALRNQADGVEIDIFGEIDSFWGYSVRQLAYDLYGRQSDPIRVRINSPGGMATEGFAISDLLKAHSGPVTTQGIGLVASIASVILLSGDTVELSENAFLMIHRPWAGMFGGDAEDLRQQADLLDKVEGQLADTYTGFIASRGKLIDNSQETTRAQVLEWMRVETWFTAAEALENGLIDAVTGAEDFAQDSEQASKELEAVARYEHVPAQLRAHYQHKINNNMAEEKATKKGLLAQLRALLVEAEEPETATTEEPTTEEQEAVDLEAARAALEAAGFTVAAPDADEDEEEEESEEQEESELATLVAEMRDEIRALRNQAKRKAGAPSGGGTAGDKKPKVDPKREKAFNAFSGTLLKYAKENS